MFTKFASIAAVHKSKKRWDPSQDPEELKILQNHAEIYTFKTYPWTLWLMCLATLAIALYLHYFLIYISKPYKGYILIILTTILYYVSFFILYSGWMEYLTIDKKKGVIKYEKVNILKSKISKSYKIDDLIDMEIVLKGRIRRGGDSTRYFIRLKFKSHEYTEEHNNQSTDQKRRKKEEILEFGECLTIRKAADKFRKCVAMLKGMIMPDIIDRGMITDESIDETTPIFETWKG